MINCLRISLAYQCPAHRWARKTQKRIHASRGGAEPMAARSARRLLQSGPQRPGASAQLWSGKRGGGICSLPPRTPQRARPLSDPSTQRPTLLALASFALLLSSPCDHQVEKKLFFPPFKHIQTLNSYFFLDN